MSETHSGGGDPKRSIELLWGLETTSKRGPKPRFTVAEIVQTAIALADNEGIAAVSMRRIADILGVAAMSLYTYLPGKAELIDLMIDRVCDETPRTSFDGVELRARLEQIARDNWTLVLRHPWLPQVTTAHPPIGPGLLGKWDYELSAFNGYRLNEIEIDRLLQTLLDYVGGAVKNALAASTVETVTGQSDREWWEAYAPLLDQVIDPARFPHADRIGSATGEAYQAASDPYGAFEFGLQRVLDGIELFVERRSDRT
jgi:AcrR family transcriptional regulator